ncbi:MAG: Non-canonical purine NTP pyrophosphatase [Candidatus Uhrbacteria bacterium GW2011_GWA2_52_8d]|uniref:dITP/XTP pyrophosphatase n=1 Tax=Candidatus Uhrbacteria bacterium GW2011_GWA2_52_8d TaxID=1618979 RepID=A0A0G1ZY40_9BACT|nr:MAG: Non-canonical purine NTP pyrophosphatase [Candidatus Uhrbacteria bacterium GW2011_GWA2_52_8d]
MKRLIFATHNPGKIEEMRQLVADLGMDVLSADEAGVHEDVEEDGTTFAENAFKKARFVASKTGEWAVADDSGIMIDALAGRPGVYTARWAGEGASDEELVRHTLEQLKDVEEGKRGASFHSVVALVSPDGEEQTFEGVVEGKVVFEPRGTHRPKLPYDVLFCPIGQNRTFAEMSDEQKNALSHRGRAFQKLKAFLRTSILVRE